MAVNRFPALIRTIENIENGRSGLKVFREQLTPPAKSFNAHIINWLQGKNYPLRKGEISNATSYRMDDVYSKTPTERLHPGDPALYAAQRFRIRKIRGVMSQRIIFENVAKHAPLFFEEIEPHYIESDALERRLQFSSGKPLPWHPANVRKWPFTSGVFFPKAVDHPGHMSYAAIVWEVFRQNYKSAFSRAINRAGKLVSVAAIRKALK